MHSYMKVFRNEPVMKTHSMGRVLYQTVSGKTMTEPLFQWLLSAGFLIPAADSLLDNDSLTFAWKEDKDDSE